MLKPKNLLSLTNFNFYSIHFILITVDFLTTFINFIIPIFHLNSACDQFLSIHLFSSCFACLSYFNYSFSSKFSKIKYFSWYFSLCCLLPYSYSWIMIQTNLTVKESDSDTIVMVIVLVAGVGGVFVLFALMALCYR